MHEQEKMNLTCGNASLQMIEHVTKTFETSYSHNTLYWVQGKKRRKITDYCAPDCLYMKPSAEERFQILNGSISPYSCPVLVNPREFNAEEYEQIARCLKKNLKTIPDPFNLTGSIRYIDENSLYKNYRSQLEGLTIQISPNGSVTLAAYDGTSKAEYASVGQLINNGKTLLLNTNPITLRDKSAADLFAIAKKAVDGKGKFLTDEFSVEPVSDNEFVRRLSEWKTELGLE